jgi:hypothetical protein
MLRLALLTSLALATPSVADEPEPTPEALAHVSPEDARALPPPERPFLFALDPSLPRQGEVLLSGGLGNVTRTVEVGPAGTGALLPTASAELGLFSRLSLFAEAGAAFATAGTSTDPYAVQAGAHVLFTDPASRGLRVAALATVGRDLSSSTLARFTLTGSYDFRALRLAAAGTLSHDFRAGADGVDLSGSLAATVALPKNFRAGVEGVFQDLEEASAPGAEGGVTAFAGPTLGWRWGHLLEIVAGPAVGVVGARSTVLGRGTVTLTF